MEKLVIVGRSYITGKIKEMVLYQTGRTNQGDKTFLSPSNYQAIYKVEHYLGGGRLVTAKPHTSQRTILTHVKLQRVSRKEQRQ